jgi:tetratricopeptide (TPR) repeat protein
LEKSKNAVDANEKLLFWDKYITSGCTDSLAECYLHKGIILNALNDTLHANNAFRKAVELKPALSEGWYQLARSTYWVDNSDSTGIIYLNHAIRNDPKNWKYFMLKGDILIARREFKSGLQEYENSVDLINNSKTRDDEALKSSYNAMGGTLIDMSQLQSLQEDKANLLVKAIENLHHAIDIDSLYENAYLLLGNAYFFQSNYEKSIAAYEKCLMINPDYPYITTNLSITYRETAKYFGEQKQDISSALKYLEKSYELNKIDIETVRLLGVANGISGNTESAIEWFKKGTELDPNNATVWWDLGTAYGQNGNQKKMKECHNTALKIDPNLKVGGNE